MKPARIVPVVAAIVAALVLFGCGPGSQQKGASMFTVSSPAFENGGLIPAEYATTQVSGGSNISIPYEWRNAPAGTKSFALVLVDHAPVAHEWVHWMVYDIPASSTALPRGASPSGLPEGAKELKNTAGREGYGGPQPPPGTGKHPYEATVYALDAPSLELSASATRQDLDAAMSGHVLGQASVTGMFGR